MVKKYIVRLTGEARERLKAVVTKGRTNAQKLRRAREGRTKIVRGQRRAVSPA
jgi:predicted DNA-binding protein